MPPPGPVDHDLPLTPPTVCPPSQNISPTPPPIPEPATNPTAEAGLVAHAANDQPDNPADQNHHLLPPQTTVEPSWQRLSWLSIPVGALDNLASFLIIAVSVFVIGQSGDGWMLIAAPVALIGQAVGSAVAYWRTRFRINGDRLEKVEGLLSRTQTSSRVDRIRTVNITRSFVQRLFGLASLDVETGSDGDQFKIVGVTHATALALKTALDAHPSRAANLTANPLPLPPETAPTTGPVTATGPALAADPQPAAADTGGVLARIHRSWPWRAGIAGAGIFPAFALFGVLFSQIWNSFGMTVANRASSAAGMLLERLTKGETVDSWDTIGHLATQPGTWVALLGGFLGFLAVSYIANVITYIIANHNFELRRINQTTLQRSAGLFSITTASIDLDRMRGVQVTNTLIRRVAGLASSRALLTTGRIAVSDENASRLLPWSPQHFNWEVADALLNTEAERHTPLQTHGPRAARRLIIGSVRGTLMLAAITTVLVWDKTTTWWVCAGVSVAIVATLRTLHAVALHRSRGNALTTGHLMLRTGYLDQTTTVVQRRVALGVRLRQGPFQRWFGLANLHVMDTAHGHKAQDVTLDRALYLAGELTPELVDQFRASPTTAGPTTTGT